jgi:hypothetical protein
MVDVANPARVVRPTAASGPSGDAIVVLLLTAIFAAIAFIVSGWLPSILWKFPDGNDIWFEGDLSTVARNLTNRWSDQSRNANHPLFPLLAATPVYALRALRVDPLLAVRVFTGAVGGMWVGLLFVALRLAGRRRSDALLFTLMGTSSAAAMFWLVVPECAGLASVSVLAALILVSWGDRSELPPSVEVAASAFTLSITITNWMAGLLVSFARLPWRKALQVSANALCVVVVAWSVQRQIFPSADFFVGYANPRPFLFRQESGGPSTVAKVMLLHSFVAPRIETGHDPKWGATLTMQHAPVGSGGSLGFVALGSWLLVLALASMGIRHAPRPLAIVIAGTLAGQLMLHAVYGEESFLYTLQLVPVLIVAASFAVETRARHLAIALAVAFIVAGAVNNGRQFTKALELAARVRTEAPVHIPTPLTSRK